MQISAGIKTKLLHGIHAMNCNKTLMPFGDNTPLDQSLMLIIVPLIRVTYRQTLSLRALLEILEEFTQC